MFKTTIILIALTVAMNAWTDQKTGPYVSASIGFNGLGDESLNVSLDGTTASGEASFEGSFAGGGAAGYRFDNGFSVEGEFLYRRVGLDEVNLGDLGSYNEGDFANTQLNVNGYYHFNIFGNPNIETYVGAGLAYINEVDIDLEANNVELEFESDEFAVEVMGGARYHLSERTFFDAGFRYLAVGDVTLTSTESNSNTVSSNYNPWMITAKFGWRF